MLKEKYQQDVYFCGIVGALVGIADGIFICNFFSYQLNNFLLKLLYVIFSLNFFAIVGVIVGFIFGMIFTFLRLEKIKKILMGLFLLLFLFAYIGFTINVFSHNSNLSIYLSIFDLQKNYEIIRLLATFVIAFFLYLLYERIFNIIQLKWKNFLFILLGMLFVDLSIWFSYGQKSKTDKINASNIRLEKEDKQFKDNFKLPPNFKPPENLLIIIIDTLRADHLGCYGYSRKTSPFIDELSQRGILFENAIAQGGCTSPSIASLYTSLYSMDHGIYMVSARLPDNLFTLAESYLQNGFLTQLMVANMFVSDKFNFNQGFMNCFLAYDSDDEIYQHAAKWLEQKREKPFFLCLHFIGSHAPYTPPKQFDRFTSDKKRSTKMDIRNIPSPFGYKRIGSYALADGQYDLDYYISKYDGKILYTDDLIRKLFNKLDQLKLTKKTLIILTADHGESFGEHGDYFLHGYQPYDDCARVPFILYYDGHFPKKSITQPIELIDVYPTVHEMMKLTYKKNKIKGRSFLPLLFGKKIFKKKAFTEAARLIGFRIKDPVEFSSHTFSAIRDEHWKLIYTPWLPKTNELYSFNFIANIYARLKLIINVNLFPQRERYELYDITKDPGETKNLYKPDLPIAQELIKELNKRNNQKNRKLTPPVPLKEIDKQTRDQIKALGYLQ